jgi:hypothetical protein
MLIVYVPVVGRVWVVRLKLPLHEVEDVSDVPSGLSNLTVTTQIVLPVTRTVTCCPVVPLKVGPAFCPGVVIVIGTAGPPIAIVPVTSGGTL